MILMRQKLVMKLSVYQLIEVVKKEFTVSIRQQAVFVSILMFSLTALACISLAIGSANLESELLAALLWIIIFFASSAIDKTFDDEAITMLKIYGESQIILFGKMIYSLLSIILVSIFLIPLFIILFDVVIEEPLIFSITIILGLIGISSAGTLISAISSISSIKNGIFPILLFPIILPLFLPAINLTSQAMIGAEINFSLIIAMSIYNLILITATSILFDSLWY